MKRRILSIFLLLLAIPILVANTIPAIQTFNYNEASEYWEENNNYYYFKEEVLRDNWEYIIDIKLPDNYTIEIKNNNPTSMQGTGGEWVKTRPYTKNGTDFNRLKINIIMNDDWGRYWNILNMGDGYSQSENTNNGIYVESENTYYQIRYYVTPEIGTIDPEEFHTVEDLPITSGSLFTTHMNMGYVTVSKNQNNVLLTVNYNSQIYYVPFSFTSNTDMTIFDGREAYYYTHNEQKFIIFNHGETSMFTNTHVKTQTFVPYTIWNLTTNEIEKFEKFNVYLYSKKEAGNNVYAYFYVDEFIIDNLLSVSLAYKYRYRWIAEPLVDPGEWIVERKILEAGTEVFGSNTSWQYDFLRNTQVALNVFNMVTLNFPALALGTLNLHNLDNTNLIEKGLINEIAEATPTADLRNEIESAFRRADSNFTNIDPSLKLFKLHLGHFNETFSKGIDIDTEYTEVNGQKGINIIEFTYSTQGEVYTIKGENIDIIFEPGPGTTFPESPAWEEAFTQIIQILKVVLYVVIGLVILFFIIKVIGAVGTTSAAISRPRVYRNRYDASGGNPFLIFLIIIFVGLLVLFAITSGWLS